MKKVTMCMMVCLMIGLSMSYGQQNKKVPESQQAFPNIIVRDIGVAYNKTTLIIFPYSVLPVDVGSESVLAEKVDGAKNVLKVKAAFKSFEPTNLTVVTGDGATYSFNLFYDEYPASNVVDMRHLATPGVQSVEFTEQVNEKVIEKDIDSVLSKDAFLKRPRTSFDKVELKLTGLYQAHGMLHVIVRVDNDSKLPYTIDFTRSSLKDSKVMKRTAVQTLDLKPYVVSNENNSIEPGKSNVLVLVYPQFGIAHHQNYILEVFERNGARHLTIKVKAKQLLKVRHL